MNSTENIREGPCVIDPFKVRLNQKLKIDVNFLFFLIFLSEKIRKSAKPSLPSQTPGRPLEGVVSEIYPLPLLHLHSNHVLQYGV